MIMQSLFIIHSCYPLPHYISHIYFRGHSQVPGVYECFFLYSYFNYSSLFVDDSYPETRFRFSSSLSPNLTATLVQVKPDSHIEN